MDIKPVAQNESPAEHIASVVSEIDALYAKATPAPWSACGDGECSCKTVSCSEYPIAKITCGEWGDTYPALRLVGDSSFDKQAQPYLETISYGAVFESTARANVCLIAALVNAWPRIRELLRATEVSAGQDVTDNAEAKST